MKLKLALCALTVSGSMFMAGQQPATTSPSNSTPPTFPSDQKAPAADQAQQPAVDNSSTQDQSSQVGTQTGSMDQSSGNAKAIEGCLSQASSGSGYILTDASGVAYNLQGDSSELSSHVGQQVKITADAAAKSGAANDSSASSASSSSNMGATGSDASANNLTVKKVKKIASSCSTSQSPSK